jgi:hypothetical protein
VITTIYKCDRCGAESVNKDELKIEGIAVGIKGYNYTSNRYEVIDPICREKDMCLKCRKELGFAEPKIEKDGSVNLAQYPTLEEMLREIMREEIEAATGAHI